MTYSKWNKSLVIGLLFLLSMGYNLSGQNDTISHVKSGHKRDTVTVAQKHALYATAGFGSNMIFLGSTITEDKPFFSTGLVYGFRNSLYLSVAATHIKGIDPFAAYYSAAADYKHTFNSWFDISAEVSGYKTAPSLEQTLFNEFIFANLTSGFDWRLLYTRISAGVLFSENNSAFLQIANSRYFQTHDFFKGKSYVSFNPEINLLFGEIITMKTVTGDQRLSYSPPFMRKIKETPPPYISYSTRFGLMNLEFSLPVTFCYGKFSFEADPCYILPAFSDKLSQVPEGFTFYMTASFRIF